MKKLTKDEMKNVAGGKTLLTVWHTYDDAELPYYHIMCSEEDPSPRCGYAYAINTNVPCTEGTNCV